MAKRRWWLAAALLLVGGLVGSGIERYIQSQHRQARAVMTLAQFHLNQLQRAVAARDCQGVAQQVDALERLDGEIVQAFPLAYAQDAEFRRRADALRDAVRHGDVTACPTAAATLDAARKACDSCHREYR